MTSIRAMGEGRWSGVRAPVGAAVALGALALLVGAPAPAEGKAPALIHAHTVLGVQCVPGPAGTVRARVRVRMVVVNGDGITGRDWATRMQVRARLVPTTAGTNITRGFRSATTGRLLQNRKYRPVMGVLTDNVSGRADWNVQVRLTWDRTAPVPDVTRTLTLGFDEGCGGLSYPGI